MHKNISTQPKQIKWPSMLMYGKTASASAAVSNVFSVSLQVTTGILPSVIGHSTPNIYKCIWLILCQ